MTEWYMDCREKIMSQDYLSLILDDPFIAELPEETGIGYCYTPVRDNLGILYLERSALPAASALRLPYRYIPQLYGLGAFPDRGGMAFDAGPLTASGILAVQFPPLSLTGAGVIIGIMDTGIDYQAPVFRFSDGSSRILAIWDQTDRSGQPPEGFFYGTLYNREQINQALASPDPLQAVPVTDEIGHGTALAAAAAGSRSGQGETFTGAAPDAMLVVVKVRPAKTYLREYYLTAEDVPAYSTDDLLMALRFLEGFAVPFTQPAAILLGMGTSLGSHTENSIFTQYLQSAAVRYGQTVVVSGGNEGNTGGHFRGLLTEAPRAAEIRVEENTRGFMAEIWGTPSSTFRISVRSPGGETVEERDFRLGNRLDHTFVYEKTRLEIEYVPMERNTGDRLAVLRFTDPAPGVWTLLVRGQRTLPGGMFDIWITPAQLMQGEARFLNPSPEITLTMPAYGEDVVTVTGYNSENNSFYYNSGQGFSRTGEKKPDLAAPGVRINTPRGAYTGTAMAAALTAGAAAQLLQWAVVEKNSPYVDGREIRGLLNAGARPAENTESYPDRQWGYGRLDLKNTFDVIAGKGKEGT